MPRDWLDVVLADRFKSLPWVVAEAPEDAKSYYVSLLAVEAAVLADRDDVDPDSVEV